MDGLEAAVRRRVPLLAGAEWALLAIRNVGLKRHVRLGSAVAAKPFIGLVAELPHVDQIIVEAAESGIDHGLVPPDGPCRRTSLGQRAGLLWLS